MSSPPPAKRVRFAEANLAAGDAASSRERPASQHTLDSDEEESGESAAKGFVDDGRLRDEDIEGQEEATIANDDGIAITPFNMREEMREGYFDSAGCYIFNKEDKEIHDSWLESVDWESVKRKASAGSSAAAPSADSKEPADSDAEGGSDSDSGSEDLGPSQLASLCSAARGYLQPGETIAGAIKRLGGGANRALSASQRLRLKKASRGAGSVAAAAAASLATQEEAAANRERMLALSELAGRLVSAGHMTAYQMDAAQLARLGGVGDAEAAAAAAPGGMDMFAADDQSAVQSVSSKETATTKTENKEPDPNDAEGVYWFYRVADEPNAELMGPFSSQRMLEWAESDTGWPGGHRTVFVRKSDAGPDAPFYSSARIDFDLYV